MKSHIKSLIKSPIKPLLQKLLGSTLLLAMFFSVFLFPAQTTLAEEPSDNDPVSPLSEETAILTTAWESVGGGRINRKYLNGLVAFCFDEEMRFPDGATYLYATAKQASITGQAAAIVARYGKSGVDNAQWWSECQVAIWAIQAGHTDRDSAASFVRRYCSARGITDAATVADYVTIVCALIEESRGQSGTAYLYTAADPANQRVVTFTPVWPDPLPSSPQPKYDTVTAEASFTAERQHSISLDSKYAAITGELLEGIVFEVYENEQLVGTIITDAAGQGYCSWTWGDTVTASSSKQYCSNYDKLTPAMKENVSGYTNREDALAAAEAEALAEAQALADAAAEAEHIVTARESEVPEGFLLTASSQQHFTLVGEDSAVFQVENIPWKARLLIHKVDGHSGQTIVPHTAFSLYEWNGSGYEISPHYQIIRLENGPEEGLYTVRSIYENSEEGYLYYTQDNQGKFGLSEQQAPDGYLQDPEIWYFEITEDGQTIRGHNADPNRYPIQDGTKYANHPVTGSIEITKEGEYLTGATSGDGDDSGIFHTDFQYQTGRVYGAAFEVYAAEDIASPDGNGSLAVYQGTPLAQDALIATITTDTIGIARLEGLPLGSYYVKEVAAGQGDLLLDPFVAQVTLSYADQTVPVVADHSTIYVNARQKNLLSLIKLGLPISLTDTTDSSSSSNPESSSEPVPLPGAVFGLYAAEDIFGWTRDPQSGAMFPMAGALLATDTLIETITTGDDGTASFLSDLPCGQYYIREISAPAGYLRSEERYYFDASYSGQDGPAVIRLSHEICNMPTNTVFSKVDRQDNAPLTGAHLQVLDETGTVLDQWISDETPHLISGLQLDTTYLLREITPPSGYLTASDIRFCLTQAVDESGHLLPDTILWIAAGSRDPEDKDADSTADQTAGSDGGGYYDEEGTLWIPAENNMITMADDRIPPKPIPPKSPETPSSSEGTDTGDHRSILLCCGGIAIGMAGLLPHRRKCR